MQSGKTSIKILLFVTLLFLFSFSVSAFSSSSVDWEVLFHNGANDAYHPFSLGTNTFLNIVNLTVASENQMPVSFDIDSNGVADVIIIDQGLIKIYLLHTINGTPGTLADVPGAGNDIVLSDIEPSYGMISNPLIYLTDSTDPYVRMLGYNSTHFLQFMIDSNGLVQFSNSVLLNIGIGYSVSDSPIFSFPKMSLNCAPAPAGATFINQTFCVYKARNQSVITLNFSSNAFLGAPMTAKTYSLSNLYDFGVNVGFKAPIYPIGTDSYFILYCNQSGKYGVMIFNQTNAQVIKSNCTITASAPYGSPKLYKAFSGMYNIFFQTADASIHSINNVMFNEAGFPLIAPSNPQPFGFVYNGNYLYQAVSPVGGGTISILQYAIGQFISPTKLQTITVNRNIPGGNAQPGDTCIAGNDYVYCGGVIYLEDFNMTVYSDSRNASSPCWLASVFGSSQSSFHGTESCTDNLYHVYHLVSLPAPALTYANTTIRIYDNSSKTEITYISYNVRDAFGNIIANLNSFPAPYGYQIFTTGAGEVRNVTATISGYNPVNRAFNFSAGTYELIVNATRNSTTSNSTISVAVLDAVTDQALIGLNVNFILINSSGIAIYNSTTSTGEILITGRTPGNYSLYVSILGYEPQILAFVLTSLYADSIFLAPINIVASSSPQIKTFDVYTQIETFDKDGLSVFSDIISPSTACINESIFGTYFAVKSDSEAYNIRYSCDGITTRQMACPNQAVTKTLFGTQTYTIRSCNGTIVCQYATNGSKEIDIWGTSAVFNSQLSDFPTLFAQGYAKKYNIDILSSCVWNQNITIAVQTTNKPNEVNGFFNSLGVSDSAKLLIGLVVVLLMSVGIAVAVGSVAPDGFVSAFAGSVAGVIGTIIFTFVVPVFPVFVVLLLALLFSSGIAISVKGMISQ